MKSCDNHKQACLLLILWFSLYRHFLYIIVSIKLP